MLMFTGLRNQSERRPLMSSSGRLMTWQIQGRVSQEEIGGMK